MKNERWFDLGPIKKLKKHKLQHIIAGDVLIALVYKTENSALPQASAITQKARWARAIWRVTT